MGVYAYVGNNPISWVDPFGLKKEGAEDKGWLDKLADTVPDLPDWVPDPRDEHGAKFYKDLGEAVIDEFVTAPIQDIADGNLLGAACNLGKICRAGEKLFDAASPLIDKTLDKAGDKARDLWNKQRSCCFVAGTQVLTRSGYKNIEDVELGEELWAKNVETREQDWKPVTRVFVEPDREIYTVLLVGEDGFEQKIEATDDCPFYVVGEGWKTTLELTDGDRVETDGYGAMTVKLIENQLRTDMTYNFTVADFHTYYVTQRNVLVHNCGENPLDGTKYTDKVKRQMEGEDLDHNFPSLIDGQADAAKLKTITGGDGIDRTKVELPGSINGKDGNFSWIIEPDKSVNHRQFERN